ncbi:MAG: amino acid adenylation domain-containing protein [Chloroflexi bacterium]|nr:amino acid adenylation domain-containing protein [Chloroflexota bacterium]
MWYLCQLAPESPVYNIARALQIQGDIDPEIVRQAMDLLVKRHASLRITCHLDDGQPVQKIAENGSVDFQFIDSRQQSAASLQAQLQAVANTPFSLDTNLLRIRLYQTSDQSYTFLIVVHHIITDFWSLVTLVAEFAQVYSGLTKGSPFHLPTLTHQYSDYIAWQNEQLDSAVGADLRTYWQHQLQDELPTLNLPTDRPRPPMQTYVGNTIRTQLPPTLGKKVARLGRELGCTPFVTFLAAYQLLLARFSGQDEILTGIPTSGRQQRALQTMQGYFVNPVVVRSQIEPDSDFRQLLQQVKETAVSAFVHEAYPFPLTVEALSLSRNITHSPVFQNMFVWQKAHAVDEGLTALALGQSGIEIQLGDLTVVPLNLTQQAAQFDLTLAMAEVDGQWLATWEYNTDLFDETTIARMADHFATLLTAIVEQPETPVSRLPLLTPSQTHDLLYSLNNTIIDYPLEQCLHHLFEQQVTETPEAIALQYEDQILSYEQLNEYANQLAHFLIAKGIKPDGMVGVCMDRSREMVVALLAILKAGGAYVPIDPSYPIDRLQFMLEDAQVPILLTQSHLANSLPAHNSLTICVDSEWEQITQESSANTNIALTADHLAYTIYTSGSTGKPKGAMNTHRAIINRLLWMQDAYQLDHTDNILQKTPFSFDVSVWEFFWPLITGATLVVAKPGGHLDSTYLVKLIQESAIITMHFVPSMLHIFLSEPRVANCTTLQRVICSGEALPYDLTQRFFAKLPACELHNLYGPTEAAIDVSYWQCLKDDPRQLVPIGRPIANIQLYILDTYLQPVPQGVAGELHIGGVGLARGYWNRPELTEEKFIVDPFVENGRLYKTGDLVRYLPDGTIQFLGRVDHQIKLRGFRIELGEIETRLTALPNVREALVVLHTVTENDQRLLAYLVPNPGESIHIQPVREQLHDVLPDYMVPNLFVTLAEFPLLSNGKVNRRALPAPDVSSTPNKNTALPKNQLEQKIAQVWQMLLGVSQVGIHDNFFDLGGHSLLLVQAQRRLQEVLGREISLVEFLEKPTIHGLTQLLANKQADTNIILTNIKSHYDNKMISPSLGLNGRFPGANTLAEFWQNLRDGVESIEVLNEEKLDQLGVPKDLRANPNFVNAEPLLTDIDQFAASFFGYAPNQAKLLAPEQRLFLEIAWHALEHAGYSSEQYTGQIGVFAGMGMSTYLLFNLLNHPDIDPTDDSFAVMLGNDKDFLATRLSYHLNLTGPSLDVQTGCSTSLVATHLACESLLNGH